jgi:intracellular multiplication protein IcmL
MSVDRTNPNNDALVMVHLRNQSYRQKYHVFVGIFLLCFALMCILTGVLVYIVKHPPRPLYFATDDAGRFLLDIPLTQPNMSTDDVMAWAVEAVEAAYSYDYRNYRAQLQNAQRYFIDYGWRAYMKGLQASNNLLALTNRKQVVIAKVLPTPKLIGEGPLGKAQIYGWKFQMEMLVTYLMPPLYDQKSKIENPLIITVLVERQNLLSSYKGLGVVQLIGELAQAN